MCRARQALTTPAGGVHRYSFMAAGCAVSDLRELGAPVGARGQLLFAGEATSEHHYGTVHGAFESGERAAAMVLQRMQRKVYSGTQRAQ